MRFEREANKPILTQGATGSDRAWSNPTAGSARAARSQRDPLRDKIREVGRGLSLADEPLRAALLKTTVRCDPWGRRTLLFLVLLLLQELRLLVGPKTRSLVPDTELVPVKYSLSRCLE